MELALGLGIPLAVAAIFFTFKSNAAILFFVACTSSLLFERGTGSLEKVVSSTASPQAAQVAAPVLVALPVLIGALVTAKHGKKWLMAQLIPSLLCGLVLYLLAVRVALYSYDKNLQSGPIWQLLSSNEEILLAGGALLCLIALPLGGKGGGKHDDKHGKHH